MATFSMEVEGLDELFDALKKAGDKSLGIAAQALYEGAGVVADAVGKEVRGISTEPFKYAKNGEKRKPSPEEKEALTMAPHGVAKFRKKLGRVDTTVGYNQAEYVDVNFSHMNSNVRTNYKRVSFKGHEHTAATTLNYLNRMTHGNLGKGAQNTKPVGVIANSINSGTSFMVKQPFIRKAFQKTKSQATEIIEAGIMARINELEI